MKMISYKFLLLLLFSNFSFADLTNINYIQSKELYASKKWEETIKSLESYKVIDNTFLTQQPHILEAINSVIAYCKRKVPKPPCKGRCLQASGAPVIGKVAKAPPPPPKLP